MSSTPIQPRPLTGPEAAVIRTMLSAGRHGSAEYLAQIPYSQVISTWGAGSSSVDIEVRPCPAPAGGVTDGIVANGAVTNPAGRPIGEVILWAGAGQLSGIEYAWYADERPTQLPEPGQIELL